MQRVMGVASAKQNVRYNPDDENRNDKMMGYQDYGMLTTRKSDLPANEKAAAYHEI